MIVASRTVSTRNSKFIPVAIAATLLAASVVVTVQAEPVPAASLTPSQVEALGVRTAAASAAQAVSSAGYPARVVAPLAQQRVVAAPLPALVDSLQVAVGDTVVRGQLLATLRSDEALGLQRDVAQADSQADLARRSLARDEQLFAEGLVAASRLEATRAQARQASALQHERRRVLEQAGVRGERGAPGQIALRAPIAGVVLEQQAVVGQRLEQAAPLYRIARLDPLWVEMQVPAAEGVALKSGHGVRIDVAHPGAPEAAHPGAQALAGRVLAVGPTVDPAMQTLLVRAEVRDPAGALRVGQTVVARVETAGAGAVHVPAAAVVDDGGASAVFVEDAPGRFRRAPVSVDTASGGVAAVRGIAPGSRVVVRGTAALKSLFATGMSLR